MFISFIVSTHKNPVAGNPASEKKTVVENPSTENYRFLVIILAADDIYTFILESSLVKLCFISDDNLINRNKMDNNSNILTTKIYVNTFSYMIIVYVI